MTTPGGSDPSQIPQELPPPLPVLPLDYAGPARGGYPGRLIAIGIISTILGGLGLLLSLTAGVLLVIGYFGSIPPPPPPPLPPIPDAHVTPFAGDYVSPSGLKRAQRELVMDALKARGCALAPDRAVLLGRFLADVGRDIFGDLGPGSSVELTAAGQMQEGRDGKGRFGTSFFETARGRVEIDNCFATFTPTTAGATKVQLDGTILTRGDRSTWSARALEEWIETVNVRRPLSGQQAAVLLEHAAQLPAAPRRQYRDDFGFHPVDALPLAVEQNMGDIVLAKLGGKEVFLLPDGRTAQRSIYRWGFEPGTCLPIQPPPPQFRPALPGSLAAIRMLVLDSVVSAALAIVLLIAGIRTLARRFGAARLHNGWALAKCVLFVPTMALAVWYASSAEQAARAGAGAAAAASNPNVASALVGSTFSLAYPVAVLCVIASAAAREYYASRGEMTAVLSEERRRAWRQAWIEMLRWRGVRGAIAISAIVAALAVLAHGIAIVLQFIGTGHADPGTIAGHAGTMILLGCLTYPCFKLLHRSRTARAVIILLGVAALGARALADEAPSTQPEATARAGARADELLKRLKAPGATNTSAKIAALRKEVEQVLAMGPEGEAAVFRILPEVPRGPDLSVLNDLAHHFRQRDIDPACADDARRALPWLLDFVKWHSFAAGMDGWRVLEKVAKIPGTADVIVDGLLQRDCPSGLVARTLAAGDPQEASDALGRCIADIKRPLDQREDAVNALAALGPAGKPLLRKLAGEEPEKDAGPVTTTSPVAVREHQVLRITAIRRLGPLTNDELKKSPPDAESLGLAAKILASRDSKVRDAAAQALSMSGPPGLKRMIERVAAEDDPKVAGWLANQIANRVPYPRTLVEAAEWRQPEYRAAAAKVMRAFVENEKQPDAELKKLADSDGEDEVKRQATLAAFEWRARARRLDTGEVEQLLRSPDAAVRRRVVASLRSHSFERVALSDECLWEILGSQEDFMRGFACERLFEHTRQWKGDAGEVLPLLDSSYADVRKAVARYLLSRQELSDNVGVETARRIYTEMGTVQFLQNPVFYDKRSTWQAFHAADPVQSPQDPSTRGGQWLWPVTWLAAALPLLVLVGVAAIALRRSDVQHPLHRPE